VSHWIILLLVVGVVFATFKLRELYRRNKELSHIDSKTGALSERGFIEALRYEVKRSRRSFCPLTVTYIDLDNFKLVNKILGFRAADEVLKQVARIMRNALREVDFVARLHGDEFALLLPDTGTESAPLVLNKLQKALREAMTVKQCPVTFSIGAVTFTDPLATPESMVEAAANVMQSSAKLGSKDCVRYVPFDLRDERENLAKCSICGIPFTATSHPFCPICGNAALSGAERTNGKAINLKRPTDICAFRLELSGGKVLEFHGPADITQQEVEAVVSAANSTLKGSGGVAKAIHLAGGEAVLSECKNIIAESGPLSVGKAVITTGGRMTAKHIIHTVGPFYRDGSQGETDLLASCYRESIRLAEENSIRSLAFPSISTGSHLYPVGEAARVAVAAVAGAMGSTSHVNHTRFVLLDDTSLTEYVSAAEEFELLLQDRLTGLPSRRRFLADLEHHLSDPQQRLSLMVMNVDGFKEVNDKFGHSAGDAVLRAIGQMLSTRYADRATFCRWGGDEFAAISTGANEQDVLDLADSIPADLASLFDSQPELRVTMRMGLAFSPEHGNTLDDLVKSANAALVHARHDGGNCVRHYDEIGNKTTKSA